MLLDATAIANLLNGEQDCPPHGRDSTLFMSPLGRAKFCPWSVEGDRRGPSFLPHDVVAPEVAEEAAEGVGCAAFEGCQRPAILLTLAVSTRRLQTVRGWMYRQ
jgi:hypothetical protein